MLSIIIIDLIVSDNSNIEKYILAAFEKRELPIKQFASYNSIKTVQSSTDEELNRYNLCIIAFSKPQEDIVRFVKRFTHERPNAFVIFVITSESNIDFCTRPLIMPSAILLGIPANSNRLYRAIQSVYLEYLHLYKRDEVEVFTIKNGGEYFSIDITDILYIEALNKKLVLRTRGQEILFYSNISTVLEQLPSYFIRCHRGIVVNAKQIMLASFSTMTLILRDKSNIPVSRTYRKSIETYFEG